MASKVTPHPAFLHEFHFPGFEPELFFLTTQLFQSVLFPKPPSMYISDDIANDMSDKSTYKTKYSRPYENIIYYGHTLSHFNALPIIPVDSPTAPVNAPQPTEPQLMLSELLCNSYISEHTPPYTAPAASAVTQGAILSILSNAPEPFQ